MIGTPPFRMITKSLHHREKPITPRVTDTIPLISKDIAKPPDLLKVLRRPPRGKRPNGI
jgi:hypothetical protein